MSDRLLTAREGGELVGLSTESVDASVGRALFCLGQTVFMAFEGFAELMRVVRRHRPLPAVLPRDLDL